MACRNVAADAAKRADAALETIIRLHELEQRSGYLTERQNTDRQDAATGLRAAAETLPELRTFAAAIDGSGSVSDEDIAKTKRALDVLRPYWRGIQLNAEMRAYIGDAADRIAGVGDTGFRRGDPIREMLASGERQHDFEFPESDAIRSQPWDGTESRAIADFSDGNSLYISDFSTRVAVYLRTMSPWINLATVVTSDNGRPLIVPTLTGDVTVYTPGEGTAITESTPTLGTVAVSPTGYKALAYFSVEAAEDESINLTDLLARSQARAIALAYGSSFTATVIAGIQNAGTASALGGYGTATGNFFGYEDLIDLQMSRAAPYRSGGAFVMANTAIKRARKWRDGQGEYLWPSGSISTGAPSSLLGNSVYEDTYLTAVASATKSVVYGSLSDALIIKASPLRVAFSTDYRFNTDQIAVKTVQRISIAVQDANAAAYLVSAAT